MKTNQAPTGAERPGEDHFLEDLAALAGLLNPEVIWQQEIRLDKMAEEEARLPAKPQPREEAQQRD